MIDELDHAQTETLRLAMNLLADEEYSERRAARALVSVVNAMGGDEARALMVTMNAARFLAEYIRQSGGTETVEGANRLLLDLAVAGMDEDGASP